RPHQGGAAGAAVDGHRHAVEQVLEADGVVAAPAVDGDGVDGDDQAGVLEPAVDQHLQVIGVEGAAADDDGVVRGARVAVDDQVGGADGAAEAGPGGVGVQVGLEGPRRGAAVVGPQGVDGAVDDVQADVVEEVADVAGGRGPGPPAGQVGLAEGGAAVEAA